MRDLDRHITGNGGEDQFLTICPDCGSANTQEGDEGLYDCLACGVWFDPLHPFVREEQERIAAGLEPLGWEAETAEFVCQVFDGPQLVACETVQAATWQEAREAVQWKFPNLVVSVHSLETYLLSGESRPVERGE